VDAIRQAVAPNRAAQTATSPTAGVPTVFYVAGIFGRVDAAPDLEHATGPAARLVTLSSPTRAAGTPGRTDLVEVAKDLADEVERTQRTGPLTMVGHSFGAMLAYSTCIELRRRGRTLKQLVVIDGEPAGSLTGSATEQPAAADGAAEEFDMLLGLSVGARDSGRPALTEDSRAVAFDNYRTNCEISRSPQVIGELECPILVVVPEVHLGIGLAPARVPDLRRVALEKLGGTSVDVVYVPGDHFTILRSPNVGQLIKHITVMNT